jgi:hypothetical protein
VEATTARIAKSNTNLEAIKVLILNQYPEESDAVLAQLRSEGRWLEVTRREFGTHGSLRACIDCVQLLGLR